MKKILLTLTVALSIGVFAQEDPVIDAVYFDDGDMNVCDSDYKLLVVKAYDNDGDVMTISNPIFSAGLLDYNPGSSSVDGDTTYFYFDIFYSWGSVADNNVGSENILVTVQTANVSDPTMSDSETLMGVVVNGSVIPSFTVPNLMVCNNGLPLDISGLGAQPGGTYSWGINAATYEMSNSTVFDPKVAYKFYVEDGGDGYVIGYEITNVNGCPGSEYLDVDFNLAPNISVSIDSSDCESANGSAYAFISGLGVPFDVYWSTGFSEVSSGMSTVNNLSSGVYYVNVTDANGCKNVAKANVFDVGFVVGKVITPRYCAGGTGSIDLSLSGPGTIDAITWSNGATTEDISTGPGEYSVHIHTDNNCNYFATYTIPDSALKVKLEGYDYNWGGCGSTYGYFDITTSGGQGTYTWDWSKNGAPTFATTEDVASLSGGVYTCTVEDGAGCSLTWSKSIENYSNVWLWTEEVVSSTCGNSNGSIDITVDDFGDVPTAYSWSNGAVTEDLINVPAGTYTLTYADQSGCESYLTVKIQNEKPYQPTICLLTVDTSLIYNMVVWEKDITQDIEGFNVYRETSTYGVFEKVADRPYALESFFQDNDASPVDRSWRYYLTTYDACGGESYPSFVHKTIHVVANTDDMVDYELAWDDYEGISYSTVDLFRYDDVNGWTLAANLPYGTNDYVDTPPVIAGLDYMVSFNLSDPCTSTKAQDHNSSRSNKTASVFMPGGSTAEIMDEDLGFISIYPNPANEMMTLHVDNPDLFTHYEIVNLNGQIVATGSVIDNKTFIELENMTAGMYFIKLVSDSKVVVEKFVKE